MIEKAMGAKVIATAGSEEKLQVCKGIGGAGYAVNYRDKDWPNKVKGELQRRRVRYASPLTRSITDITSGHGADVVFDPV